MTFSSLFGRTDIRKLKKRAVRAARQSGGHGSPSHTYTHHHGLDGDVCKETNKSQRWVNQTQTVAFETCFSYAVDLICAFKVYL